MRYMHMEGIQWPGKEIAYPWQVSVPCAYLSTSVVSDIIVRGLESQ